MMNLQSKIETIIVMVKQELQDAEGGHDWFHIERVWRNAKLIAQTEKADLFVVELAALLHDIADSKFNNGDEDIGPRKAREILLINNVSTEIIDHVVAIIVNISFKGGNTNKTFNSIELQIVQDADRLDAIGAIGIARAFNYGGFKNRLIFDPTIKPNLNQTKEEYKNSNAPTINHFYEKLLLLKDRMNTATGKELAQQRHQFMEAYLEQFYSEWNGNA
jgi:uncharacterized protein